MHKSMKKTCFILLCFSMQLGFTQNINTTKLVDLLHGKKIEQITRSVNVFSLDSLKIKTQVAELKTTLSKVYEKEYSKKEIESLILFYKSDIGKKMLLSQASVNNKVLDKIYKWEAKTQGIELLEENDESLAITEPNEDILDPIKLEKQTQKKRATPKKQWPKINDLEDLKKLINKESDILYDSQLLAKLLGVEELLNPILVVDEVLPGKNSEKKN